MRIFILLGLSMTVQCILDYSNMSEKVNDTCFAPCHSIDFGPICYSSQKYVGAHKTSTIQYVFDVPEGVSIFCLALAASYCPLHTCELKYWNLITVGNGTSDANLLTWGNYSGVPSVFCRSYPRNVTIGWSWKPGKECFPGCYFGPHDVTTN